MVIFLVQGANLHMAQLMPLPLTISCFGKIQIGFTFLVPAHPGSPGQRAVKWVCVCVLTNVKLHALEIVHFNFVAVYTLVPFYICFLWSVNSMRMLLIILKGRN